jgi:hypothetical protein
MTTDTSNWTSTRKPRVAVAGIGLGGVALVLVLVTLVSGPFPLQHSAGITMGEIPSATVSTTLPDMTGMDQPIAQGYSLAIDRFLQVTVVASGLLAALCGAVGLFLRERRDIAGWAIGLGICAVTLQFLASTLIVVIGALIVCALIHALGDVLSFG